MQAFAQLAAERYKKFTNFFSDLRYIHEYGHTRTVIIVVVIDQFNRDDLDQSTNLGKGKKQNSHSSIIFIFNTDRKKKLSLIKMKSGNRLQLYAAYTAKRVHYSNRTREISRAPRQINFETKQFVARKSLHVFLGWI